jgi:hypothetical protein
LIENLSQRNLRINTTKVQMSKVKLGKLKLSRNIMLGSNAMSKDTTLRKRKI